MEPKRILIVDDEAIIVMAMRLWIERAGYRVVAALPTGEAAVDYLGRNDADLVLMDGRLAGAMDGIEAARRIRALRDLPLIFITGYQYEEFVKRATGVHPLACLSKPVDYAELLALIDAHFAS